MSSDESPAVPKPMVINDWEPVQILEFPEDIWVSGHYGPYTSFGVLMRDRVGEEAVMALTMTVESPAHTVIGARLSTSDNVTQLWKWDDKEVPPDEEPEPGWLEGKLYVQVLAERVVHMVFLSAFNADKLAEAAEASHFAMDMVEH